MNKEDQWINWMIWGGEMPPILSDIPKVKLPKMYWEVGDDE